MRVLALALVLIGCARIVATYPVFNQTWDEPGHIAAGVHYLDTGRYLLDMQHPPLARIAMGLGPYLAGLRPTGQPDRYMEGNAMLHTGERYDRNLALARVGILAFFILGAAAVWLWGTRLGGNITALIAVLLYTTLPPVLAHAGLATTDMAAAGALVAALVAFEAWLERPLWKNALLLALACAAALLAKFSLLLFLPLCAIPAAVFQWLRRKPARRMPQFAAVAVLAGAMVWAAYSFSFGYAGGHGPLPAPELFAGLLELRQHGIFGHSSYLLGEYGNDGWWYFFPVALAVKTPLAFLALAGCGAAALIRKRAPGREWVPLCGALAILAVCIPSKINLGVRHILPIYPLLALIAAAGAVWLLALNRRWAKAVCAGLLLWHCASSALAHPDYLAYFNELAGREPERILAESDLDWGQDLKRLGAALREAGAEEVSLSYFGTADAARRLPARVKPLPPYEPVQGWVAVSIYNLKIGGEDLRVSMGRADSPYAWLAAFPARHVGKSILLYYVSAGPRR